MGSYSSWSSYGLWILLVLEIIKITFEKFSLKPLQRNRDYVITGMSGADLVINDSIYNSFVMVVLGCFGIAGLEKFANKGNNNGNDHNEE